MPKEKKRIGYNQSPSLEEKLPKILTPDLPPIKIKNKKNLDMYGQAIAMLFKELVYLQHDIKILKSDVKELKNAKINK